MTVTSVLPYAMLFMYVNVYSFFNKTFSVINVFYYYLCLPSNNEKGCIFAFIVVTFITNLT